MIHIESKIIVKEIAYHSLHPRCLRQNKDIIQAYNKCIYKKQLIIPAVLLMVQCVALGGGLDSEGSPYFLTFFTTFPASLELSCYISCQG